MVKVAGNFKIDQCVRFVFDEMKIIVGGFFFSTRKRREGGLYMYILNTLYYLSRSEKSLKSIVKIRIKRIFV